MMDHIPTYKLENRENLSRGWKINQLLVMEEADGTKSAPKGQELNGD